MSGQLNYTEADALLSKPVNFHHFKWFYSVDFNIDPNEINLCIYITASKSLINVGKLRGIGLNYCFICLSSEIRTYLKDTFPFFFYYNHITLWHQIVYVKVTLWTLQCVPSCMGAWNKEYHQCIDCFSMLFISHVQSCNKQLLIEDTRCKGYGFIKCPMTLPAH